MGGKYRRLVKRRKSQLLRINSKKKNQSKSEINEDSLDNKTEKIFSINLSKRKKTTESEENIEKLLSIGSRVYHITYQNECPICFDIFQSNNIVWKFHSCSHVLHEQCMLEYITFSHAYKCPLCTICFRDSGKPIQPNGEMIHTILDSQIPGFDNSTVIITFSFFDGYDEDGCKYTGSCFTQILPLSTDGRNIYYLFEKAFNNKVLFKIQQSSGTSFIVPNSISFKSSNSEYLDDPDYLNRIKEEFKNIGIE